VHAGWSGATPHCSCWLPNLARAWSGRDRSRRSRWRAAAAASRVDDLGRIARRRRAPSGPWHAAVRGDRRLRFDTSACFAFALRSWRSGTSPVPRSRPLACGVEVEGGAFLAVVASAGAPGVLRSAADRPMPSAQAVANTVTSVRAGQPSLRSLMIFLLPYACRDPGIAPGLSPLGCKRSTQPHRLLLEVRVGGLFDLVTSYRSLADRLPSFLMVVDGSGDSRASRCGRCCSGGCRGRSSREDVAPVDPLCRSHGSFDRLGIHELRTAPRSRGRTPTSVTRPSAVRAASPDAIPIGWVHRVAVTSSETARVATPCP
jgi:hypothetical protein